MTTKRMSPNWDENLRVPAETSANPVVRIKRSANDHFLDEEGEPNVGFRHQDTDLLGSVDKEATT